MKILSISLNDLWPFGKDKGIPSMYYSQKGFVQRGHQVYFLCRSANKDYPHRENCDGIDVFRFRFPFGISSLTTYNLSLNNLWRYCMGSIVCNVEWFLFQLYGIFFAIKIAIKLKPDLVYCHGLSPAFVAYLVSRLFRTKLVIRVYGTRDFYWRWHSFRNRLKDFRDVLSFKIPADLFVITKDGTYADVVAKRLGVAEEKILCLNNGVNFSIYDQNPRIKDEICKKYNIDPFSKIILSTSRLTEFTGVDRLVFALPELFKKEKQCICIIASQGYKKQMLEDFVKSHGMQSRVFFVGVVTHKEVNGLLNASDIFVSLSRFSDRSNAMIEAMICGKCIVTIDRESIQELLKPNESAVLINSVKLAALSQTLERLLRDDDLRNRLGKNARESALKIFESWDTRIKQEVQMLEELYNHKNTV